MSITAQFSIYPLRTTEIGPTIEASLDAVRACDVSAETGTMSTLLEGSEENIFAGLRAAFHAASEQGDAVLLVTISNACKPDC